MKSRILILFITLLGFIQVTARADDSMEPPVPVRTVPPVFPDEMKRSGTSGVVTVSILIDEKGNVQEPKVIKTSHEAFSQPAMDALAKWKFKPAKQGGAPIAMRVNIPVQFTTRS